MPKKYLFLPIVVFIVIAAAAGVQYMHSRAKSAPQADEDTASAKAPFAGFTAFNETWRAVVSGDTIDIEGDGINEGVYKVTSSAYAKGVEFTGNARGVPFTLNIHPQRGADAYGNKYELGATFYYGKKTLKGYARPEALERADT